MVLTSKRFYCDVFLVLPRVLRAWVLLVTAQLSTLFFSSSDSRFSFLFSCSSSLLFVLDFRFIVLIVVVVVVVVVVVLLLLFLLLLLLLLLYLLFYCFPFFFRFFPLVYTIIFLFYRH